MAFYLWRYYCTRGSGSAPSIVPDNDPLYLYVPRSNQHTQLAALLIRKSGQSELIRWTGIIITVKDRDHGTQPPPGGIESPCAVQPLLEE